MQMLSCLLSLQVFVPSDSMGAEVVCGAGICIASTNLLFNDRTVEQVCIFILHSPCYLKPSACNQC